MLKLAEQEKPIRRVADLITDHREEPRSIDGYVVSLYPNGTLGFRGCRRSEDSEVRIPLASCLTLALEAENHAGAAPSAGNGNHINHGRNHGRKSPCTTRKPLHRRPAARR